MRRRLVLTLACWSLCAQAATAEPIRLTCRMVIETTGELEGHTAHIDLQARVVQDNAMTLTDGATSPLAANVEKFVTIEGLRATLEQPHEDQREADGHPHRRSAH